MYKRQPYTGGYNTAEAAYTAAANDDTNVKTQVISADTHQADVTGLKFGTRYILALGNVEPEENKFTAYDNISFTTGDLQVNFQVTSVNKDSIGVAADVTKNFEVEGDNSFYFAVYSLSLIHIYGSYSRGIHWIHCTDSVKSFHHTGYHAGQDGSEH